LDWRSALGYAQQHLVSLLFSPLLLWIGIVLVVLAEVILLLLGRIPYLGELWAAILFLPLFLLNLFLILLGYLGVWLIPAVVADEGVGVVDTLRRVEQLVRRAPGRILAYLSIAVILGLLASMVLVPLTYWALASTTALTGLGLGSEKLARFAVAMPDLFSDLLFPGMLGGFGSLFYGVESVPFTFKIAAVIYAVSLLLIPVSIIAILFVVFPLSCACATYISVSEESAPPAVEAQAPPPPRPPESRTCAQCGAPLSPDDVFCMRCGAPQSEA
jgi:hypothetical protein